MCGIAAICCDEKHQQNELFKESIYALFTELLYILKKRGTDATGISTIYKNGDWNVCKAPTDSSKFILFNGKKKDYTTYVDANIQSKEKISCLLGHCRKTSIGKTTNINNHPILALPIIGVHNGTLKNHIQIKKSLKIKTNGDVDSEVLFKTILHYTNNGTIPFTDETITNTVKQLIGTYTILTVNAADPNKLMFIRYKRPLHVFYLKELSSLVFVSEKSIFTNALFEYNKSIKLYKRNILDINSPQHVEIYDKYGGIVDFTDIPKLNKEHLLNKFLNKIDLNKICTDTYKNSTYNSFKEYSYKNNKVDNKDKDNNNNSSDTSNSNSNSNSNNYSTQTNKKAGYIYIKRLQRFLKIEDFKEKDKLNINDSFIIDPSTANVLTLDDFNKKINSNYNNGNIVTNNQKVIEFKNKNIFYIVQEPFKIHLETNTPKSKYTCLNYNFANSVTGSTASLSPISLKQKLISEIIDDNYLSDNTPEALNFNKGLTTGVKAAFNIFSNNTLTNNDKVIFSIMFKFFENVILKNKHNLIINNLGITDLISSYEKETFKNITIKDLKQTQRLIV